jgi:methyl-accepting chemotaxis protein
MLGAGNIVEASPAALVIADGRGEIVYRNRAATAQIDKITERYGAAPGATLRSLIKEIAAKGRFPHHESTRIVEGEYEVWAQITVDRLGDHLLANWRDISQEAHRSRLLTHLVEELGVVSSSFESLGGDLALAAGEVSSRTEAVAAGTEQLTASIRDISASASTAAANTGAAVQSAGDATNRIVKLGESSAEIGGIGKLINAIAEQTNLLALNATIEAARAGEAGKGFAVVAGEVKDLAHRTSEATSKIARMIEAIQSDSADARHTLEEIVRLIGQIEEEQTTIASAVEEQSATAAQINASVAAAATAAQSSNDTLPRLRSMAEAMSAKAHEVRAAL